ncbi:MAG TPA: AraC family transcriptional regulator [Klebsiella sp.]|jgi:AraC-like DNA-binding protein/mannose-6-phosphate isomerase-like protein (cupin superfamily)
MTETRHICQRFTRLPGVELRSTWQSRQAYKYHRHTRLSIGAITKGQTCCICNGREYILNPGDIVIIPANAPHSCNPVDGQPRSYHMLYIETDLQPAQQMIRSVELFSCYQQIVEQIQTTHALLAIEKLLALLPGKPAVPETLRPSSQQLQQALLESLQTPPSLETLARTFALRKETLIRTFKQDTGMTPGSFLNMARVEYAKTRLLAGDNIADVSYQSGFADQSRFHKTFVSYTSATPRQYATGRSITDNN